MGIDRWNVDRMAMGSEMALGISGDNGITPLEKNRQGKLGKLLV